MRTRFILWLTAGLVVLGLSLPIAPCTNNPFAPPCVHADGDDVVELPGATVGGASATWYREPITPAIDTAHTYLYGYFTTADVAWHNELVEPNIDTAHTYIYDFFTTGADAVWNRELASPQAVYTQKVAYIPVKYKGEGDPIPSSLWQGFTTWGAWLDRTAQIVSAYYWEQSYGLEYMSYDFVFDEWMELPRTGAEYPSQKQWWKILQTLDEPEQSIISDAIALAEETLGFDLEQYYDAVLVVHPDVEPQADSKEPVAIAQPWFFGEWAHELGHALPDLDWADYYSYAPRPWGDIGWWGLMGEGAYSIPPAPVMSHNKVIAGWLDYETVSYGTHIVRMLRALEAHADVPRWGNQRIDIFGPEYTYYIFEGRYPPDDVISDGKILNEYIKLEQEEGVLLYGVTRTVGNIYTIPHNYDNYDKVTLTNGDTYSDHQNSVVFTAKREGSEWEITSSKLSLFGRSIFSLGRISIEPQSAVSYYCGEPPENPFDIDLHAFAQDGRRVGMDYDTKRYVVGIEDAEASGNILGGGPEWISVPDDERVCFAIDATPAREWVDEIGIDSPEVKAEIQAIHFDDEGGRTETGPVEVEVDLDQPLEFVVENGQIKQISEEGFCFIATAAYGTHMADEVRTLRDFRDQYLLTNALGQAFVDLYYSVSPPIAGFVTEHPSLKPIVRAGLAPAVAMSVVVVNTTEPEKLAMVGLLVMVSVAVAIWATRRRERRPECS